jgi:hypothetical protein
MYPIAIGVIDSKTNENWKWFMERLKEAIGTPPGLTFSTYCDQPVMAGVSEVFPYAKHRECMWHFVQNFKKRYSGKVLDDHLWAAAHSWNSYMFDKHIQAMTEANPATILYLQEIHTRLWTRSQYSRRYTCTCLASAFLPWVDIGGRVEKEIIDKKDSLASSYLMHIHR